MANFPRRLGCGSSGKTACCCICCRLCPVCFTIHFRKHGKTISRYQPWSLIQLFREGFILQVNASSHRGPWKCTKRSEAKQLRGGENVWILAVFDLSLWVQLLTKCTLHRSKSWTRGTSQFHTKSEESAESIQSSQHPYPFQHTSHFRL